MLRFRFGDGRAPGRAVPANDARLVSGGGRGQRRSRRNSNSFVTLCGTTRSPPVSENNRWSSALTRWTRTAAMNSSNSGRPAGTRNRVQTGRTIVNNGPDFWPAERGRALSNEWGQMTRRGVRHRAVMNEGSRPKGRSERGILERRSENAKNYSPNPGSATRIKMQAVIETFRSSPECDREFGRNPLSPRPIL